MSGKKIYKNGVKAFTELNPVSYSKKTGIYRSQRWGKNLEVFFLDERSFRSSLADYNGDCDNPPGSGNSDLAPTAPESTRSVFAVIAPQLANPVPQACLDAINDPNRTMLGQNQLKTFEKAIKKSKAKFKVIFNEVPIQQYYALPYDRWEGYAAEREKLLAYIADHVDNAIFMTTDVHANLVNDARYNTLGDAGVQDSGILESTDGPVATENYSGEINSTLGNSSGGGLIQSAVPEARAARRRRHAVRRHRSVQLRRGDGEQQEAQDRPARRPRPAGAGHGRRGEQSRRDPVRAGRAPREVAEGRAGGRGHQDAERS